MSASTSTVTPSDKLGKPFLVLTRELRQCLVCEEVFSRQSAPKHAFTVCYPPGLRKQPGTLDLLTQTPHSVKGSA